MQSHFGSGDYPKALNNLVSKPEIIYYWGDLELAQNISKNIAIVGTRNASLYGKISTQNLITALKDFDCNIVSGLARGIDSEAHTTALRLSIKNIAIIGSGLNHVRENKLGKQIVDQGGLIISELEADHPALNWTFAARNRIIAALSSSTVVVEAGVKSGALITANDALKLERRLFALSGEINKNSFQGNMALLDSKAAEAIYSARSWVNSLNLKRLKTKQNLKHTNNLLIDSINQEPISIDMLNQITKLPQHLIAAELSKLEAQGLIKKISAQRYIRTGF